MTDSVQACTYERLGERIKVKDQIDLLTFDGDYAKWNEPTEKHLQ